MPPGSDDAGALAQDIQDDLATLRNDVSRLSGDLTSDLARALVSGQELDGLLQTLILKQSDRILNSSLSNAYDAVGSVGESLVGSALNALGGATSNIFNVNIASSNPSAFRSSETQLASTLARAVSRGQRSA